ARTSSSASVSRGFTTRSPLGPSAPPFRPLTPPPASPLDPPAHAAPSGPTLGRAPWFRQLSVVLAPAGAGRSCQSASPRPAVARPPRHRLGFWTRPRRHG